LQEIKNISVIGAGNMGNSIALTFALHKYQVRLWSRTHKTLDRAQNLILSTLKFLEEFGRIDSKSVIETMGRIRFLSDLSETADGADFAIETVAELPDVKIQIFNNLDEICSNNTILASNTSGLNIYDFIDIKHPERLIIAHWFSPPHLIPLVEVIPGPNTSKHTIDTTQKILSKLAKKPVLLKQFVPSFIVNRIQNAINKVVLEMIDNNWATPADIDSAIKYTLGIRLPIVGVAQALDFTGLDLINHITQRHGEKSDYLIDKVNCGHLGVKTSKGIYDYGGRNEAEILKKRDLLFYKMLDHLTMIEAFEPI